MSDLPTAYELVQQGLYSNAPYTTESRLVGSDNLSLFRIENNPAGHFPDPPSQELVLAIQTKGAGFAQVDVGAGVIKKHFRKGDMVLAPAKAAADFQVDFSFDLSVLGIKPKLFRNTQAALHGGDNVDLEKLHVDCFQDPLVEHLVERMFIEAVEGNPNGTLFVDHAAHTLVATLLGVAEKIKLQPEESGPLTDDQLAVVVAMMEDQLQEKLTLEDLAQSLDWDVFRFSRAFKAATGTSPHQFLLARRVERARDLLADSAEPLASIAYDCGFSSQAHMTTMFSKHMGITPGSYRREVGR